MASLLDRASEEGEVRIKRRDDQTFVIKPEKGKGSPLDVERVKLGVTTEEVVKIVQEGRRRDDD
jgi:hypothetical protein